MMATLSTLGLTTHLRTANIEPMSAARTGVTHTDAYYNEHAQTGADPLFHKRPEFVQPLAPPYAVLDLCNATSERYLTVQLPVPGALFGFTLGGLRTNVDSAVLTGDSQPIAGLFAAGRASAGLAVGGYCSGISLGDCTFFGRRAGQSAARR